MNKELRKHAKNDSKKDSFKLTNNQFFWKTMENVSKHKNIKLVTVKAKRNYLVSEKNDNKNINVFRKIVSNRDKNANNINE